MADYRALARRYRPKLFKEVLGQEAIITTLKNAIKSKKVGHAYLFCGLRGTGKTTIARLFAKGLNCQNLQADCEPCNVCASCKEIVLGNSLDVMEIDGASNRGIEDVRRINETVIYSSSGKYKIYIIDEVHMLTKDAFNALLKTLEEPPPNVKFLFATTEPHKVLPTILSRCQRFNLNRIPQKVIVEKLQHIAFDLKVTVEEEALQIIAQRAEGGMRDAESLFDQVLSFFDGELITRNSVAELFGLTAIDVYFEIDEAGKEGNLGKAFELADQLFSRGKDFKHFVEGLIDHFRNLLLIKLSGKEATFLTFSDGVREKYVDHAEYYSKEQCLAILDYLMEAQHKMRFASYDKIGVESLLLWVLRSHSRLSVEQLVRRLTELEKKMGASPIVEKKGTEKPVKIEPAPIANQSVLVDPTPTARELGIAKKEVAVKKNVVQEAVPGRYDTLMQFAAVELEGTIQKR